MGEKSIKKNAILNVIRSMMTLIYPLITFPYTSRILMPDGIGKVRFAQSIVSYFSIIAGLGISSYAIREAASIRNDKVKLSKFTKEIFIINILSMTTSISLFFVTILTVPRLSIITPLLLVCGLSIIFETISLSWLFTALEEFSYITIRSIVFQIISLSLLFLTVRTKEDYLQYALLNVIASGGSSICNLFYSRKFISFRNSQPLNLKQHLKPIFIFFSMALITSIYTIFDTSMLGFLSTETQVGYYSAATKINRLVLSLITAALGVTLPRLSNLFYKNNNVFFELFYKILSFVLLLSLPATVGLNILAPKIILLFSGELYLPATNTMRIMNPIIVIIALGNVIGGQLFFSCKKEKYTMISECIGAVVNFVINLLLIPKLGSMGAAIATICAESIVTIAYFIFARKMISLKYITKDFIQYIFATAIMALGLITITRIFKNTAISLWFGIFSSITVYSLLLILLKNQIAMKILATVSVKINTLKHKEFEK